MLRDSVIVSLFVVDAFFTSFALGVDSLAKCHLALLRSSGAFSSRCEVIQSADDAPEDIDQYYTVVPTERMTECLWRFTQGKSDDFKAVPGRFQSSRAKLKILVPKKSSFLMVYF